MRPWAKRVRFAAGLVTAALLAGPVAKAAAPATLSPADYRVRLATLHGLAQACHATAAACDSSKVGEDVNLTFPQDARVHWQWLRDALESAKSGSTEARTSLMQDADARLMQMQRDAEAAPGVNPALVSNARGAANRILAGSEFDAVQKQSWLDRAIASFYILLSRIFSGFGGLNGGPWLGQLMEFLLFGSAAVGLLFFALRSLKRQRLAIAMNGKDANMAWERDSTDWAALAEARASAGDWREAVHCLYWASIVMLERRKAWRHNPARTPREYVRLLKPGSAQQRGLRGLTQIFERLWYGLREASAQDYARALGHYEELRTQRAENEFAATQAGAA